MKDSEKILEAIAELKKTTETNFKMVNKRLDGIEHELALVKLELKKIDTVIRYQEEYDNIPG